jgi:3-oxoacyl-[acyl-carrier protein] reductase
LVKELEKEGVQALALQADQGTPLQVEKFVQKAAEHFGRIDVLVNNAAIFVEGCIDDPNLDIDGIARQWAVNVGGVFSTTRAAIPFMGDGGRIIIIGSINGERMTTSGAADYMENYCGV